MLLPVLFLETKRFQYAVPARRTITKSTDHYPTVLTGMGADFVQQANTVGLQICVFAQRRRYFSTPSAGRRSPLPSSGNSAPEEVRTPKRRRVNGGDWKPGHSHPRSTPKQPELGLIVLPELESWKNPWYAAKCVISVMNKCSK